MSLPGQVFVDIPIGLTATTERTLEQKVRGLLPGRTSSVFSVPVRAAVYAQTYESACALNQSVTGKKITLQAWHICRKVREVDEWLAAHPEAQHQVHESHPELVFQRLNGSPLTHRKKTREGIAERLDILARFRESVRLDFEVCLAEFRRKDLARDDIVDAMALSLLAELELDVIDGGIDDRGMSITMSVPRKKAD